MYTSKEHAAFAERLGNFMRELRQLQIESVALQEIYAAQALLGESSDFVDVGYASVQELKDAMDITASYLSWLDGSTQPAQENRRPATTAFLQLPA